MRNAKLHFARAHFFRRNPFDAIKARIVLPILGNDLSLALIIGDPQIDVNRIDLDSPNHLEVNV